MSTTPTTPLSTTLALPPGLDLWSAAKVKDWCKLNWRKIEAEHITMANLKTLVAHLGGGRSIKKKLEGVVKLLQLINVEEGEKEGEEEAKEEAKEEGEEESMLRKGQKCCANHEEEKQEEIRLKDKEAVDVQPAKNVCTIERKPVALPEETLSIPAKASYFLNLTYGKLGMFWCYSHIFFCRPPI